MAGDATHGAANMLKSYEARVCVVRRDRRSFEGSFAERVPGVAALAGVFRGLASLRMGRVPIGLVALLPVAIFLDLFDVADELVAGPLGVGLSFLLESAFLLALTGRATYAFAFAGIDLIPVVDVIPFATITLVRELVRAWGEPPRDAPRPPDRVVIDV